MNNTDIIIKGMTKNIEREQAALGNYCKVTITEELGNDGKPKYVAHMEPDDNPSDELKAADEELKALRQGQQMMQPFMQKKYKTSQSLAGLTKMGDVNPFQLMFGQKPPSDPQKEIIKDEDPKPSDETDTD